MRSGTDTLAGIEDALRDLKAQEDTLRRELEAANEKRAGLVAERLEALKKLAAVRATEAIADGVINAADNLSDQVTGLLVARQRTVVQLVERQRRAETDRQDILQREAAVKSRIASLEERLDRFGAEARAALAGDPSYNAAAAAHSDLASMLEQAAAKAEQVARDEAEKGLPYRNDPLFMYLWRRGYGTSTYQASGLVRALDDWVAGLLRFADAHANYAMLTEIPVRLRAHADDIRRQTVAAKSRLDEMEAARTRELAGADLVKDLQSERLAETALAKELETVTSELSETGAQLRTYAKAEDQSFQTAVTTYARFLEREPLRQLIAEANATPDPSDDRAVADVRRIADAFEEVELTAAARRRRLDQISERKVELARLASNFRRQRYDDVGSEFDDKPGVEDLLQLLLRGAITAAEYWARMQAQQHWRHRPADPWRRQSGLPPFDGFPGGWGGNTGGGWGGSGSSSGGSRGGSSGNDFETGGTF